MPAKRLAAICRQIARSTCRSLHPVMHRSGIGAISTKQGLCLNAGSELKLTNRGANMSNTAPVVHSDPDILGGTPVFVGTRVPFRNLIDYLERNHSLDEFLDSFPSVSREQAVASLEAAHEAVSALAHSD